MRVAAIARQQQLRQPAESSLGLSSVRKHRPDYVIVVLTALLLGIGLIVMYSISPALAAQGGDVPDTHFVSRQAIAVVLGVIAFMAVSRTPLEYWVKWQKPLMVVALLLCIATIVMDGRGNRWIQLGAFSFQPVEFVKFVCVVVFAGFLVRLIESGRAVSLATLKPLFVTFGVFGVVIVGLQLDLGSAVVLMSMAAIVAFVAGMPLRRLFMFGCLALAVVLVAIGSTAYRRDRLLTFLQPERDCVDVGYHACQAMIAVGSGGVFGLGLGQSVQAYGYLPEAENDSIFAIYAEKFGFVGTLLLIAVIGALLLRILGVMQRAPNRYSQLVVAGVFTWLSIQAVINIGAMIGILPIKGITLPFISYGGTSLIFAMAALGLVFQVSKHTTIRSQQFAVPGRAASTRPSYNVTRRSV